MGDNRGERLGRASFRNQANNVANALAELLQPDRCVAVSSYPYENSSANFGFKIKIKGTVTDDIVAVPFGNDETTEQITFTSDDYTAGGFLEDGARFKKIVSGPATGIRVWY